MSELGLLSPHWLLLLATTPVAYWLLQRWNNLRTHRLKLLGQASEVERWRIVLPLLTFACLALSLTRPYWGYEDVKLPRSGRDIMLAVDISLSMATKDLAPSRMDFAKRKIRDIIDTTAKNSPGDRLGIVLFAGESYLYCPLTADYSVLRTFANTISVGLIASGGSAITQALTTAANSFNATKSQAPAVLLISDGEDNEMVVQRSLDVLKGMKLRLWALGIGTLEGSPIELQPGRLLKDNQGQIVISKLQETNLKTLASGSGGLYQAARIDDSDLRILLGDLNRKIGISKDNSSQANYRVFHEFGPILLWIPLLLLTLTLYARRAHAILGVLFPLCLLGHLETLRAEEVASTEPPVASLYDAQKAYERGEYQKARDGFASFHSKDPADTRTLQALASSEFKLGNLPEASKLFSELAKKAKTPREEFEALYDKGTTELIGGNPEQAIEPLEAALKIKPGDEAAQHNLDLARKKKEEEQKKHQKKQKQQQDQQKEQEQEQKSEQDKKQDQAKTEGQKSNEEQDRGKPEADPTAQSEQTPEETPASNGNPEGSSTPAATTAPRTEATPGNTQNEGEQAGSPTPNPNEESGESSERESAQRSEKSQKELPQHDPQALKEREARSWLESLDDSPILLRRQVGNKRSSQQQSW